MHIGRQNNMHDRAQNNMHDRAQNNMHVRAIRFLRGHENVMKCSIAF